MPQFEGMRVLGKCREQRFVRDQVDAPRQPVRGARNPFDHIVREQVGAVIARRAQTEHQVFAHLVDGQRHQSETVGNALAQLADIRLAQILIQLGLAEQHDLQQLVVFGFQIGQQAHFFQRCQRHALRFFDKNHHALAVGVAFEQVRLYGLHDFEARRLAVEVQMQLEGDGVQNFFG